MVCDHFIETVIFFWNLSTVDHLIRNLSFFLSDIVPGIFYHAFAETIAGGLQCFPRRNPKELRE